MLIKYLHKEIEDLNKRYEIIIIDAGGQDSIELRSAMTSSSVTKLYTPLQPSEFDLNTLTTMDDLVFTAKSFNNNLEAFLVFNQSPTHSKIHSLKEAKEFSQEFKNINICHSIISHRVPFQYATSHYMSVVEFELERIKSLPAWQANKYIPKASIELCALYEEIFNKKFKDEIINSFPLEQASQEAIV